MIGRYHILTISHKEVSIRDLANFFIQENGSSDISSLLNQIKAEFGLEEIMYLHTCNRSLFFFYHPQIQLPDNFVGDFFHKVNPTIDQINSNLIDQVKHFSGALAIQHLFEVASSLESMVPGEREILRQLREAYSFCKEAQLCGDKTRIAIKSVVKFAKKVYTQTAIGEKPVSVVSLAFREFFKRKVDSSARVLMIGAGQTNTLAAKFFLKHGYKNITVFNRSSEAAQKIADKFDSQAQNLDTLTEFTGGFDVMFVCTGSQDVLVTESVYKNLRAAEDDKKIIIDLSVPTNVDKNLIEKYAIDFIEIESLKSIAAENLAFREKEILKVKGMLDTEMAEFKQIFQRRQIELSMNHVPQQIRDIKNKAINEVFAQQLNNLSPQQKELVMQMMDYMEKKYLASSMKEAKKDIS